MPAEQWNRRSQHGELVPSESESSKNEKELSLEQRSRTRAESQDAPKTAPIPALQSPTPQGKPPQNAGRRKFLKALFVIGAVLSMIPFIPWGSYLQSSVELGSGMRPLLQKAVIDDLSKYGDAAGKAVNVNDLTTFPPNSHWLITYPTSGDPTLDAQNPDTFVKFDLIRLPGAAGSQKKASDFVAFSKVCVHLWCSPNYNPAAKLYECPCHGSVYRIPDGLSIAGPASLQAPPTNAIPMLTLLADSSGYLYIYYSNIDPSRTDYPNLVSVDPIQADGEIGYGRDYKSYENFILPSAWVQANTAWLDDAVG